MIYGYIYLTTNKVDGKMYIDQHKSKTFDESHYAGGYHWYYYDDYVKNGDVI